jgi:GT2 family glycosyltransferase
MRICAVVVTHNRKTQLLQAVSALQSQSHRIEKILVVDNASTDGTADVLSSESPDVEMLRLEQNLGSAGGFHAGIDWAFRLGFDWIWTLDDDSIPHRDALAELLSCREKFDPLQRPDLLASRVVWADGSLHPMNVQKPKLYNVNWQFLAAEHGAMSIRFTTFTSMLVHRRLIEQYGLPVRGYFMWNDDVDWSARILRKELGVMVPGSVVVHNTAKKNAPAASVSAKFFYEIRNKLWIVRHSSAFDRAEKWWMARSLIRRVWGYLRDRGFKQGSLVTVARGMGQGIWSSPPDFVEDTGIALGTERDVKHAA